MYYIKKQKKKEDIEILSTNNILYNDGCILVYHQSCHLQIIKYLHANKARSRLYMRNDFNVDINFKLESSLFFLLTLNISEKEVSLIRLYTF